MSFDKIVEKASTTWPETLLFNNDDGPKLVLAGQNHAEPLEITDFTPLDEDRLANSLDRGHYHRQQILDMDRDPRAEGVRELVALRPIQVQVMPAFICANISGGTMEWLASSGSVGWQDEATTAMHSVLNIIQLWLHEEDEEGVVDLLTATYVHEIEGVPDGRRLVSPYLVANPLGGNVAIVPEERNWTELLAMGSLDATQHNVDSFFDTLPIAAGFAAINNLIVASFL